MSAATSEVSDTSTGSVAGSGSHDSAGTEDSPTSTICLHRDVPGFSPLQLLLKALWFANHAATSVERHVTVPLGERDKVELRRSSPVLALVFAEFGVYPQEVQVGIW